MYLNQWIKKIEGFIVGNSLVVPAFIMSCGVALVLGIFLFSACQPVIGQNGEPSASDSTTYNVQDVGEVTAWRDPVNRHTCYFWGNHMFCVQGD